MSEDAGTSVNVRGKERVRVLRLVLYEGDRKWVEATVAKSVHGRKDVSEHGKGTGIGRYITAVTINEFPEILDGAKAEWCGWMFAPGMFCTRDAGHDGAHERAVR